jgi:hypothetical protein
MGFKLGPYLKAERPDRWRSIVFDDPAAWLVPPRIWQNSTSLMPAHARRPRLAHGRRLARRPRRPPARTRPRRLPARLLDVARSHERRRPRRRKCSSRCAPSSIPRSGRPPPRAPSRTPAASTTTPALASALAGIEPACCPLAARPDETRGMLARPRAFRADQRRPRRRPPYSQALLLARRQRQLLLRADAAVQVPRPGEFVGVWDHDGTGFVPGDWNFTANLLAAHGVTALFPNVVWGGCAHYPSKFLPASNTLRLYGDQIAAGLAAAKAKGLQYHVWMVLWKLDGAPPEFVERMKKEGRLQISDCRHHAPVAQPPPQRQPRAAARRRRGNRAQLSGHRRHPPRLHPPARFVELLLARHPRALRGRHSQEVPALARRGQGRRQAQRRVPPLAHGRHHRLVADIRATLRRANPSAKLSAAVFGIAAPDGGNIAQYWPDWLRAGTVDFLTR